MAFFKIFNPDFQNEYYTSMFNQIVNQLPPYPALFDWDTIPKAGFSLQPQFFKRIAQLFY